MTSWVITQRSSRPQETQSRPHSRGLWFLPCTRNPRASPGRPPAASGRGTREETRGKQAAWVPLHRSRPTRDSRSPSSSPPAPSPRLARPWGSSEGQGEAAGEATEAQSERIPRGTGWSSTQIRAAAEKRFSLDFSPSGPPSPPLRGFQGANPTFRAEIRGPSCGQDDHHSVHNSRNGRVFSYSAIIACEALWNPRLPLPLSIPRPTPLSPPLPLLRTRAEFSVAFPGLLRRFGRIY